MPAKNYSLWAEVVDILFPILDEAGIKILILGDKDSPPLNKTISLAGQTTIHQSAYILNRALLHMGNDSILGHVSCANDINTVLLYGPTTVANHSPYHHNPDKSIFIESHRNGNKATFAREENPKTIDMIKPEEVAAAVCKLLNLPFNYPYKTFSIGSAVFGRILESGCTDVINTQSLNLPNIIMRLDINYNLAILTQQLSVSKCSIVTDREIPQDILVAYRPNIVEVCYRITDKDSINFCKVLKNSKITYRLFTTLNDEQLNAIKLDYLDYPVINRQSWNKDILKDKDIKNIFIKSAKITLVNGKIYQSHFHYLYDLPIPSFDTFPQPIIVKDIDELLREQEYLLLMEKV